MSSEQHWVTRFSWGVVGFIGNMLVFTSFMIGLFIFWQIYWTTMEANAYQEANMELFKSNESYISAPESVGVERTSTPPKIQRVNHGESLGLINIPKIHGGKWYSIAEGSGLSIIDLGYFGRYTNTNAYPGEVGNFSMAAHRISYGNAMKDIDKLETGDAVIVESKEAYYIYKITEPPRNIVVEPHEVDVISADPYQARELIREGKNWREENIVPTRRFLTITSCHPKYVSSLRMIAHAEFSHWVSKTDGTPKELVG